jgi:hypothetical protein
LLSGCSDGNAGFLLSLGREGKRREFYELLTRRTVGARLTGEKFVGVWSETRSSYFCGFNRDVSAKIESEFETAAQKIGFIDLMISL